MPNWLERMCQRATNHRIAFWMIVTFAALLVVVANHRYAKNFITGPFSTSSEQLDAVSDVEQAESYYVRVIGSKTIDTGIQQITTTTRNGVKESERVSAGYFAVLVGDRFLVVKSPSSPSGTIEGELKSMPDQLRSELSVSLGADRARQYIRPLLLDTEGFRYPGYWAIAAGLVLLFCLFRYMRPAWILRQDISRSPIIQRVKEWGDPISLAIQIEGEYRQGVQYRSQGRRITENYVIHDSFFTFNVLRFQDLVWAYKQVTQHSWNFIPTGKSYNAVMVFYGGSATVSGSSTRVDELLQRTALKAPWAIFGFSKELERLFKDKTEDFCTAVEIRRRELQQKA
jgi:hypothetical protein